MRPDTTPLFRLRPPVLARVGALAFMTGGTVLPWLTDVDGNPRLLFLRIMSPAMAVCLVFVVRYGLLTYQTVSAAGITEWRGMGRSARRVAHIGWDAVEWVGLYSIGQLDSWPRAAQFQISGRSRVEGRRARHTMYVPSYADRKLAAVNYLLARVPPAAVSPDVRAYVAWRQAR